MLVKKRKTAGGEWVREISGQSRVITTHGTMNWNHARRERVGTALKARIESLVKIATGNGCGCSNLATQMDIWGISGCESRRDEIITHLVGNRDTLVDALRSHGGILGHASGLAAAMLPDIVLRAGASSLLDQAIEDVKKQNARQLRMPSRHSRDAYTGWKSDADWPETPFGPFDSNVRHLTYHVWPTKHHDGWKWNLEQLAARWQLFNGSRILGIATDSKTVTPVDVLAFTDSLGIRFDHVVSRPNQAKLREVVTWLPMLELLSPHKAGPDEVVFSSHAKGVRHDDLTEKLEAWTRLMYVSCLDDWPLVESQLSRHLATGSFRRYGNFTTPGNYRWHYSGTFFWWRLAEIAKRKWRTVDQRFFGTESWIGHQCRPEETGCLFLNDCGDLYQDNYWEKVVWPAWSNSSWAAENTLPAETDG